MKNLLYIMVLLFGVSACQVSNPLASLYSDENLRAQLASHSPNSSEEAIAQSEKADIDDLFRQEIHITSSEGGGQDVHIEHILGEKTVSEHFGGIVNLIVGQDFNTGEHEEGLVQVASVSQEEIPKVEKADPKKPSAIANSSPQAKAKLEEGQPAPGKEAKAPGEGKPVVLKSEVESGGRRVARLDFDITRESKPVAQAEEMKPAAQKAKFEAGQPAPDKKAKAPGEGEQAVSRSEVEPDGRRVARLDFDITREGKQIAQAEETKPTEQKARPSEQKTKLEAVPSASGKEAKAPGEGKPVVLKSEVESGGRRVARLDFDITREGKQIAQAEETKPTEQKARPSEQKTKPEAVPSASGKEAKAPGEGEQAVSRSEVEPDPITPTQMIIESTKAEGADKTLLEELPKPENLDLLFYLWSKESPCLYDFNTLVKRYGFLKYFDHLKWQASFSFYSDHADLLPLALGNVVSANELNQNPTPARIEFERELFIKRLAARPYDYVLSYDEHTPRFRKRLFRMTLAPVYLRGGGTSRGGVSVRKSASHLNAKFDVKDPLLGLDDILTNNPHGAIREDSHVVVLLFSGFPLYSSEDREVFFEKHDNVSLVVLDPPVFEKARLNKQLLSSGAVDFVNMCQGNADSFEASFKDLIEVIQNKF